MKLLHCCFVFLAFTVAALHAQSVPTISSLTPSQRRVQGESLSLSVSVNGTAPFTYQWNKGAAPIAGATASTYVIDVLVVADAGTYTVTVTNAAGSVTSSQILVDVSPAVAPTFNYQPGNLTYTAGDTINFYASVNGTPPLTFVWKKGTETVATTTSYSYSKANTQTSDAGTYTVTVTNAAGSVVSQPFTVTVNAPTAPVIGSQPSDATVNSGDYVWLSVYVDRSSGVTYQWYKDGAAISGATSSSYTISGATTAHTGTYTVKATNAVGTTTSRGAVVTVRAPVAPTSVSITSGPLTVTVDETLSLSASANGTGPLTFQWKKDGVDIAGATSSSYYKSHVTANDSGTYTVVVSNAQGSLTSSGTSVSVSSAQAPIITRQPASLTVYPGDSLSFSVNASGTGQLSYQWRKDGVNIANATSSYFSISHAADSDAGVYTVVVTNLNGSVTSLPASLTVVAALAPTITAQPRSLSLNPGEAIRLSVSADGRPYPTYQWKMDGVAISGATNSSFYKGNAASSDSGSYTVVVSNSAGTVESAAATVNVGALSLPEITYHPASASLLAGDYFSGLSIGLPWFQPDTYTIAWYRDGVVIPNATSSNYSIYSAQPSLAGTYKAVVTNGAGSTTSYEAVVTVDLSASRPVIVYTSGSQAVAGGNTAYLNISVDPKVTPSQIVWKKDGVVVPNATTAYFSLPNFSPGMVGTYTAEVTTTAGTFTSRPIVLQLLNAGMPPRITTQPGSGFINIGGNFGFGVSVDGEGPLSYQWQKDGTDIPGATSSNYSISSATSAHAGNYTVVVTNRVSSATSSVGKLSVSASTRGAPIISQQPVSQSLSTTSWSLELTVGLLNPTGAETYQWYKDDTALSGYRSSYLYLSGVTAATAGRYKVVVTNSAGSATSDEVLITVTVRATGPSFTTQPHDQTGYAGGTATFTAVATGGTVTYQWRKDGALIAGATDATLSLTSLKPADAGTYSVLATNADGTTASSVATLTVNPSTPPQFTTHPASANGLFGGSVAFSAAASGEPAPTYQWKRNDVPIAGATSATLTLTNLQAQDAGTYTVSATNAAGTAVSNGAILALYTVLPTPPAIGLQPQSVARALGGIARFTITATGTAPLTVQWYKDAVPIAGATSMELLLSNIKQSDVGTYSATVSNPYGTAYSSGATLTIGLATVSHVYTGTFSTGEAWALAVFQDQTAQFLGYVAGSRQAVLGRDLVVASDGSFSFGGSAQTRGATSFGTSETRGKLAAPAERLFTGRVSGRISGDAVSGEIAGVGSFSGTDKRGSVPHAGWYDAVPFGTGTGELHAIAAPDGSLVLVDIDASTVRGGVGTISAGGALSVTTAQFAYTGSLAPATTSIAGIYTPTGGKAAAFGVPPGNGNGNERLVNVSTRAVAGTDSDTLIIGFVITGSPTKDVMVRALGPTLGSLDVTGYLTDPRLKLFQRSALLGENDNWGTGNNVAAVTATASRLGAYPLPAGSADAVMLSNLSGGVYTAHVNSHDGHTGIALLEVYDADATAGGARIVNLSARSRVGRGDDILIVGFVITGSASKQVLVRGLGPRLVAQSVTGVLENPRLKLFKRSALLGENDDWSASPDRASLSAAAAKVGATALDDGSKDAALLVYLEPGIYTAQVSGVNDTTGVALVEVYDVP